MCDSYPDSLRVNGTIRYLLSNPTIVSAVDPGYRSGHQSVEIGLDRRCRGSGSTTGHSATDQTVATETEDMPDQQYPVGSQPDRAITVDIEGKPIIEQSDLAASRRYEGIKDHAAGETGRRTTDCTEPHGIDCPLVIIQTGLTGLR